MDIRKPFYLVPLKRIVSYAGKASLNVLAADFGDTARSKGAGESDRATGNCISRVL